ncbi:MAG: single-stranded-DNA-specific exonuclease RecJ [Candidatus Dadabacteria bacterium]|nr:single-stranded-DNA-specific exonuclease RecJ [Candidatus Dadabacteria bacterium]
MKKSWVVHKENPKLRDKLSKALGISPITSQVLINRGIENEAEAELYLKSTLFDLPSPFLLKDMDKAVNRIMQAIERGEKIAVYGDYDVDGVTSTALLYHFLKGFGALAMYYNPDRLTEGYGVNFGAVERLKQQGVSLIISGDCGITAWREIEEAKKIGVDFIVTDHHTPPEVLPDAVAVLNPHQPGCAYPGKEIAGVGVVFNLVMGLRRVLRDGGFFKRKEPNLGDYLDLVALGTVADCASLTNVNRVLVREGIKRMHRPKRAGIRALKEVSGLSGEIDAGDIGFRLGPRVNASGRLNSAREAVELLISEDMGQSRELAKTLNSENQKRQAIEADIFSEAITMVESSPELSGALSIVLESQKWHPGVIGIVASKIAGWCNKPAVLIAVGEDGVGKGSGRGVEGLNLYDALAECKELFVDFGGHELAAGLSIREENIDAFKTRFEEAVAKAGGHFPRKIHIDGEVDMAEVDESLLKELDTLSPYGIGNPEPVFVAKCLTVVSSRVLKEKHLSITVSSGGRTYNAIWFNFKGSPDLQGEIDVVFTPEFNVWNGKKEVRIRVLDID